MRRSVGLVLLAIGTAFLALALSLRFYVLPALLVTPIDQFAETFATGTGTVFNPATLTEENNVALTAHRTLRGDVAASSDKVGVWDESVLIEKADGSLVKRRSTEWRGTERPARRSTAAPRPSTAGRQAQGAVLQVPVQHGEEDLPVLRRDGKEGLSDELQGLGDDPGPHGLSLRAAHRARADRDHRGPRRPDRRAGETAQAARFYSNTRSVWIEPLTGIIIKGQEKQHQVFRNSAGEDKVTLIDVTLTFNAETQKQQADLAKDGRSGNLVGLWGPLGLGVVGLILIAWGSCPSPSRRRRAQKPQPEAGTRRRRLACRSQTKIAVPGTTRPRNGLHAPHVLVRSSGHSGSTRSTRVRPAAVISRTLSQRCDGAHVGRPPFRPCST